MKKIILVFAVLSVASPAFAQDFQAFGLYQPYQAFLLDDNPQLDQSYRFYLPFGFEKQQQTQNYQPAPAKQIHKKVITNQHGKPADMK